VIPVPRDWTVSDLSRGFLLVHPGGNDVAAIRYRERAGAPRRLRILVDELLASIPGLGVHTIAPVQRFVTDDGELAAMVSIDTADTTGVLHLHAAYVFTDDFYSMVVGYTRDRSLEVRELVRELAQRDNHALGIRRRRFEYEPPPGWQPLPRGLSTAWIPADYPDHDTRVLVYPANPTALVGRAAFGEAHAQLEASGWVVIDAMAPRSGTTRGTLVFEAQDLVCRRHGVTRLHRVVVARDSVYQYPLELYSARNNDEDRAVLDAVLDSIKPFAAPITNTPALGGYWVD
jgi:hypothetical protein